MLISMLYILHFVLTSLCLKEEELSEELTVCYCCLCHLISVTLPVNIQSVTIYTEQNASLIQDSRVLAKLYTQPLKLWIHSDDVRKQESQTRLFEV